MFNHCTAEPTPARLDHGLIRLDIATFAPLPGFHRNTGAASELLRLVGYFPVTMGR
jgi:hypothetical protein